MSKDEFQMLKEIFRLNEGTIVDGVEKYTTVYNNKKIVLTFNPKNIPPKRYNIEIERCNIDIK